MILGIKPLAKNSFPLEGVLIKSSSVKIWIKEIQLMNLSLATVQVYPVPGMVANTTWGCFVLSNKQLDPKKMRNHELCQRFSRHLYIPENSIVHPSVSALELEELSLETKHVMHPEFGLLELNETIPFEDLIIRPNYTEQQITKAADSIFLPQQIKSFQIQATSPSDIIEQFENEVTPKKKRFKDKPLNPFEKTKLELYKKILQQVKEDNTDQKGALSNLKTFLQDQFGKGTHFLDNLQQNIEELERRNQKEADKLMDLLKKNPLEGLKYAIPLDHNNSSRNPGGGGSTGGGSWGLSLLWKNFSLGTNMTGSGSSAGSVDLGDSFFKLEEQYKKTALELIDQKDFKKAAFVYMKLLKDYSSAAATLESGHHYEAAAAIYLEYVPNKKKAAECYEKGKLTLKAIELYKELEESEKVGDLYMKLQREEEAMLFYQNTVDKHLSKDKYHWAANLYSTKMKNTAAAKTTLLEGWRKQKEGRICLNDYFHYFKDDKDLRNEISRIYAEEVSSSNRIDFLNVLIGKMRQEKTIKTHVKEMAYEIIAEEVKINPYAVKELKAFIENNPELVKDSSRFITKNKR